MMSTQIPAMEKTLEANIEDEKALAIWDLGSPLYDSYELVSITHLIERQLMTLPSVGGSKRLFVSSKSKKISPASDILVGNIPAAQVLFLSNMGANNKIEEITKRVRSSSISNTLSEFKRKKLWIKRSCWPIGSYNRKDKSKKLKAGHCGFCTF